MRHFRLSRRADEDLTEIFAFGYDLFGEAQAEAYADAMIDVFALLADNPQGRWNRAWRSPSRARIACHLL